MDLLFGNNKLLSRNQTLEGRLPKLDFRVTAQCVPGQELKDLLAFVSAKVYLLTADGVVAFEGNISWDIFSTKEIADGRGIRAILTQFQCNFGPQSICPIDVLVSVTPAPVYSTGK